MLRKLENKQIYNGLNPWNSMETRGARHHSQNMEMQAAYIALSDQNPFLPKLSGESNQVTVRIAASW